MDWKLLIQIGALVIMGYALYKKLPGKATYVVIGIMVAMSLAVFVGLPLLQKYDLDKYMAIKTWVEERSR